MNLHVKQLNRDGHLQEKVFDCSFMAMIRHRAPPSKSIMVILKGTAVYVIFRSSAARTWQNRRVNYMHAWGSCPHRKSLICQPVCHGARHSARGRGRVNEVRVKQHSYQSGKIKKMEGQKRAVGLERLEVRYRHLPGAFAERRLGHVSHFYVNWVAASAGVSKPLSSCSCNLKPMREENGESLSIFMNIIRAEWLDGILCKWCRCFSR